MKHAMRVTWAGLAGLGLLTQLAGCPIGDSGSTYVAGGTGDATLIGDEDSIQVLTPVSDLSVVGGTQVEVNWRAFARSRTSVFNIIIDPDQDPDNNNEILAYTGLALSESQRLVDTTRLDQGTYNIGVTMVNVGEIVAFDYADGQVLIDQRPQVYFTSPRNNFTYDRGQRIIPTFTVTWELSDPDSTNTVQIFLDPDDVPNGNEVLLFESGNQAGDSFTFDLPTAAFEPGVYRILALVSDGINATPFYVPGSIRLRARLSGAIDLRNLNVDQSTISGAIFEGFNPRDNVGSFVAPTEDVDGDGFDDFIIIGQFGKPRYQINPQFNGVGEGYLVYGRAKPFSGVVNLNSTGTLFRGEIYGGVPELPDPIRPSRGITSFAVLSDWDEDGTRDFAFGLPFTDSEAVAYLDQPGYFRTGGVIFIANSTLGGFGGQNYFPLAEFGTDPNPATASPELHGCQDGFEGPKSPPSNTDSTYFYARWGTQVATLRLGARFSTVDFGDQCGEMLSPFPLPDIVGLSGLLISVPNRDPATATPSPSIPGAGCVTAYFASAVPEYYLWNVEHPDVPPGGPYHYVMDDLTWSPGYEINTGQNPCTWHNWVTGTMLPLPRRTARIYGGFAGAAVGNAIAVEDFNADGIADFAIGSPLSNAGAGSSFIVLGRITDLVRGTTLSVEQLGLPMDDEVEPRSFDGIRVVGSPGERLGQSQAPAGDFNNDGITDVVIGSPLVNSRRGGATVFYGAREVINLTEEEIPYGEIPSRGLGVTFVGEAEGDYAGARVTGIGDVDADGNDDILIAAPHKSVRLDLDLDGTPDIDRTNCGVVYLIYGAPDLATRRTPGGERGYLELKYVGTEHLPGAVFIGRNSNDQLGAGLGEQGDRGFGVSSAGDVNGDGFRDILLGAVGASPRDRLRAGEVYLLYAKGDLAAE